MQQKVCSKCERLKPLDDFHRDKSQRCGRSSACKICSCQRRKEYYQRHRAECSQRWKDYYQRHRAALLARDKAPIRRAQRRAYARKRRFTPGQRQQRAQREMERRRRNGAKVQQEKHRYYQANKVAIILRNAGVRQRRVVAARQKPHRFTSAEWEFCLRYWGHCCAYCGAQSGFWTTLAMDHFIALTDARCPGTVAGNIVPACNGLYGCNTQKQAKDPHRWLEEKFGKQRARQIGARIETYFQVVAARMMSEGKS